MQAADCMPLDLWSSVFVKCRFGKVIGCCGKSPSRWWKFNVFQICVFEIRIWNIFKPFVFALVFETIFAAFCILNSCKIYHFELTSKFSCVLPPISSYFSFEILVPAFSHFTHRLFCYKSYNFEPRSSVTLDHAAVTVFGRIIKEPGFALMSFPVVQNMFQRYNHRIIINYNSMVTTLSFHPQHQKSSVTENK